MRLGSVAKVQTSRRADFRLALIPMTEQEKRLAKKRGRPATGRGQTIGVRMLPAQLAALDAWIAKQPKRVSRPEAIRAMVTASLEIMGDEG